MKHKRKPRRKIEREGMAYWARAVADGVLATIDGKQRLRLTELHRRAQNAEDALHALNCYLANILDPERLGEIRDAVKAALSRAENH